MPSVSQRLLAAWRGLRSKPVTYLVATVIVFGPAFYKIHSWKKESVTQTIKKDQAASADLTDPGLGDTTEAKPESSGGGGTGTLSMIPKDSGQDRRDVSQTRTWEELQRAKVEFEERVLKEKIASRVRLETPAILRKPPPPPSDLASRAVGPEANPVANEGDSPGPTEPDENPETSPGYVAFMASPEVLGQGVELAMAQIALRYFESFPGAARVTISLIVGGGVRRQSTFFNDGSGGITWVGQ